MVRVAQGETTHSVHKVEYGFPRGEISDTAQLLETLSCVTRKIFLGGVCGSGHDASFFVVLDTHGGHEQADRGVDESEILEAQREGRTGRGWCRCGRGRCSGGCGLSGTACRGRGGGVGACCVGEVSTLCHQKG